MDFRYTFQNEPGKAFAGVDVGGTKIAVLLADMSGKTLARIVTPTNLESPERTISSIVEALRQALKDARVQTHDLAAVGIGIPGRVDTRTGVVQQAVNLKLEEVAVGPRLSSMLGVPCILENDVRLAAMGIQRRSTTSHYDPRSIAYVSVGTGIAAGLVIEGRLYRGAHGMAGEIGHSILDPKGPLCACGSHGCLEAMSAGPAIARMAREAITWGTHTTLNPDTLTSESVYQAATEGDALAYSITKRVGRYLAQAIQQLIMHYDVERIILGGGVSRAGAAFLTPILEALQTLRSQSDLAHEMIRPGMISLLDPEYDAGQWGGIALATDLIEARRA